MWVLRKNENNWYVADNRKCNGSYTNDVLKAQKFTSKEQAIRNSCVESEHPVSVYELLY